MSNIEALKRADHLAKQVITDEDRKNGNIADLVFTLRTDLLANGIPEEQIIEAYDSNEKIIFASNKMPEVQRIILNTYWTIQLMNCEKSSINVRAFLLPNASFADWYKYFKLHVLPFIIENKLPKVIK